MTIVALKSISKQRINIPKDIALVGFDDFDLAYIIDPSLTLISQLVNKIGKISVDLLVNRIENPDIKIIQIPAKLKIRQSCYY